MKELIQKLLEFFFEPILKKVWDIYKKKSYNKKKEKYINELYTNFDENTANELDKLLSLSLDKEKLIEELLSKEYEDKLYRKFREKNYGESQNESEIREIIRKAINTQLAKLSPEQKIMCMLINPILDTVNDIKKKVELILNKCNEIFEYIVTSNHKNNKGEVPVKISQIIKSPDRYLNQMLIKDETEKSCFTVDNFIEELEEILKKEHHIFITGEGARGKTVFMENANCLYTAGESYYVRLIDITYEDIEIKSICVPENEDSSAIYKYLKKSSGIKYNEFYNKLLNSTTLLLLDGVNEIPKEFIDKFLAELRTLREFPCNIIITSRKEEYIITNPVIKEFCEYQLEACDQRIDNLKNQIDKSNPVLSKLIEAPMYYYMVLKIYETHNIALITTKFKVIDISFKETVEHQKHKYGSNSNELRICKLALHMAFPTVVYYCLALKSLMQISICDLISSLKKIVESWRKMSEEDFLYQCQCFIGLIGDNDRYWELIKHDGSLPEKIAEKIINMGVFVQKENEKLVLGHQDFRDYAAALYYKTQLHVIEGSLMRSCQEKAPVWNTDFNLKHLDGSTVDFVLEAVLVPGDINVPEEYYMKYEEHFLINDINDICDNMPAKFLKWSEVAIQIGEALITVNEKQLRGYMFDQYKKVMNKYLDIIDQDDILNEALTDDERIMLDKVLLKGAEMYRRDNKFLDAQRIIKWEVKNVDEIVNPEVKTQLTFRYKHHLAKIKLYWYQYELEENSEATEESLVECTKNAKEAIRELIFCAEDGNYIYSANLMGYFHSSPVSCIKMIFDDIDYIKAFWYFYHAVFRNGQLVCRRQEAAYSIRKCIGFLLEGKVHIVMDNPRRYKRIQYNMVENGGADPISITDKEIAQYLLKEIENTKVAMRCFYQGIIEMHNNNFKSAESLFEVEGEELLSMLMRHKLLSDGYVVRESEEQRIAEEEELYNKVKEEVVKLRRELKKPCKIDSRAPQYSLEKVYFFNPMWRCV